MFLGHIGAALAAKRAAPRTSLGLLLFASQLLDGLWAILLPAGLDREGVGPVLMAAVRPDFGSDSIAHAWPVAAGVALVLGLAIYAVQRSARGALVLALLVLSHPLLDAPARLTGVTLWPGAPVLPLRGPVPVLLLLECAIFLGGLWSYLHTTRARDRVGSWGLGTVLAGLIVLFAIAIFPSPPLEAQAFTLAALSTLLAAPLGSWIERHRCLDGPAGPERMASRLGGRGLAMGMFL